MTRPFRSAEEEAMLAIIRTADVLGARAAEHLKLFDLTPAQYNVLRILAGSPDGLACGQIGERMITRDPDVTRLLDRMETRGWITRERSGEDRRVVTARITGCGQKLIEELEAPIAGAHKRSFAKLSGKQVGQLVELLQRIRET